ncbi:MAG: UDP-N-acetylmuramate--L-alanine ligase [Clostridia bacterium]|nr:MAG: UDP-N-acetylmuramate--L-alanine ligase [Clostridia bacterium]
MVYPAPVSVKEWKVLGAGIPWIHFVGIGGSGMSGVARVLLEQGYRVSGSDLRQSGLTADLARLGAEIYLGHADANVRPGVTLVVVSTAIPRDNPEIVAARSRGIPVISRGEMLARLMHAKKGIAVAGSHGKTTTTAMISLLMAAAGLDPTVIAGGVSEDIGGNARCGHSDYLVAEADESDGSFLLLTPWLAVVTNVEDDHLDYYGSLGGIHAAFGRFLELVRPGGKAVVCLDDPVLAHLAGQAGQDSNIVSYGFKAGARYTAGMLHLNGRGSACTVYVDGSPRGELRLAVPGRHNILNALAALAVAEACDIGFSRAQAILAGFRGVRRRFQVLGRFGDIWVVDDYAHHPTEIRATLEAASQVSAGRVIAVFQPHRFTRTRNLYREFGQCFGQAAEVIVTDIYPAGEPPIPGISAELIVAAARENGHPAVKYMPREEEIVGYLAANSRPGDLIITLGAGDVYQVGHRLTDFLAGSRG